MNQWHANHQIRKVSAKFIHEWNGLILLLITMVMRFIATNDKEGVMINE